MFRKITKVALYLLIFPGAVLLIELLHLHSLPRYQTLAVGALIAGLLGYLVTAVVENWVEAGSR